MANHNKTLQLTASKLGLADNEKVIRKAAEFERLLQAKSTAGSNMTDTSKVVICLDLAACLLGVELDTKVAIKYSGLKVALYTSCRKIVENLLEISGGKLTVSGLCVMLQCTGAQELAESILEEYRKQAKMEIDFNLPHYVCMAVYQACRMNKVKITKSKVIEKSRLKPAQFAKLEADFTKFVDANFGTAKRKRGRTNKTIEAVGEAESAEVETSSKEELGLEPPTESYEDWKRRMLEMSYRELEELQKEEQNKKKKLEAADEDSSVSPRKNSKISQLLSPRKRNRQLSPRKVDSQNWPAKVSQQFTSRKNSQQFSLRIVRKSCSLEKANQNITSPREDIRLASSTKVSTFLPSTDMSQHLSSPKVSQRSTPKKDPSLPSPMQEDMSPRRSPRKTPQKFSPYKSPSVKNGIRLLFPRNL